MIDKLIELAVEEDLGLGDITSDNIFSKQDMADAYIYAKEDLVLCGVEVAEAVFNYVSPEVKFTALKEDGAAVKKGQKVITLKGSAHGILTAERVALNFLQRMSAVAGAARAAAAIGKKYGVMIVDTRKSLPGMRKFDKYAVRTGGARNHRMSLADSVLIKDNHIAAAGGIKNAVAKIKANIGHTPKIEVEVKNLKEVKEALSAGAEIIMFDNMSVPQILEAKKLTAGRAITEVSGGVNMENLEEFCKTGVDVISMGSLTHSVKNKDLSLIINFKRGA